MSNPTDPPRTPDDLPGETAAGDSRPADEQPTEAYPPASDAQETVAYPAPDAQPTAAYPAPEAPATDAYGQPLAPVDAAAQPVYAPPAAPTTTAPAGPDTRPKRFGWIALGLAVGGLVLVLLAFIPLLWVSFGLAIVGGILLLAGLVLGIVTLVNKKQGGKGLGIGAIIVSVLGGGAWVGALVWSLLLIGLASAGGSSSGDVEPSPPAVVEESATPAPSEEATEEPGDTATGTYDEAAFLAAVRPEITALFQEIEPSITESDLATVVPDETLVGMGEAVLQGGETGRNLIVESLSQSGFTEEQAGRFFDTIFGAAQQYLVQ